MPGETSIPAVFFAVDVTGTPKGVRRGLLQVLSSPPCRALTAEQRDTAQLLLAEVLNNIVEHAYAGRAGDIRLWIGRSDREVLIRIEDEGCPMPGGAPPEGQLPAPEDLAEGGFGWHLIRSLSSHLRYERQGSTNRLSLVMELEQ